MSDTGLVLMFDALMADGHSILCPQKTASNGKIKVCILQQKALEQPKKQQIEAHVHLTHEKKYIYHLQKKKKKDIQVKDMGMIRSMRAKQ